MSERCRECQKRPARRRGLCVYCVRTADDERYGTRLAQKGARYRTSPIGIARRRAQEERERERQEHESAVARALAVRAARARAAEPSPALRSLIAEQERDAERWIGARRGNVSLDVLVADGTELHELFGGCAGLSAEEEFFDSERAAYLWATVGDASPNDATWERLPDRLAEMGIVGGPQISARDRARLRAPLRHRGEAPPPTFQRMAPRHRGRREQIALMSGKRTSRKQRGRWNREKVVY